MKTLISSVSVVSLVALAGCITDPVTGKTVMGMPTSELEETQMGQSYRPVVLQEFSGAYPDPALQSHLSKIVLGMARRGARPELPWTFTVVNSSTPNAFAVPGGEVFMTRGLLWRLDDEAEFAVVMGHEIGHVEHRHTVQSMGRNTIFGALGQLGGQAIGSEAVGGLATGLLLTRFSRDQERESDVRGVYSSYHAGYDPRQGADVFREFLKIKQEAGGGEGPLDSWTSSHPLDSERIANIGVLAADIDPRLQGNAPVAGLRVQTGEFAQLIAKLRGEQKVYDRHDAAIAGIRKSGGGKDSVRAAIGTFDACARELPNHAYFANTAGKAYLISGDTNNGRAWLDRAASMNQGLLEPEYLLGTLSLESKRFDDAAKHAQRGLAILPDNYYCLWVRGEAYLGMGREGEAKADFERVMQAAPADSPQARSAAAHLGLSSAQPAQPARPAQPTQPKKRKRN